MDPRDETKEIRLTGAQADLLAELAQEHETSRNEILRQGLRAINRMHRRPQNIRELIELAEADEPEKIGFELKG